MARCTSARRLGNAPSGRCLMFPLPRPWASSLAGLRRWSLRSRFWSGASRPGHCRPMMPWPRSARCAPRSPTPVLSVIWMGLQARLEALFPVIAKQRAARKAERARQHEETRAAKERFVLEAERLAAGNDWRGGVNRFRVLLEEWKSLPRLDRATDDALWHRFSSARTTYTRRRKAQFAQQNEQREAARVIKEKLVTEAEALAGSTDWGPTTGAFRDLMARWKAAGPAPRDVDELLWKRFREAQDRFFMAKQAALSGQHTEFRVNAQAKEKLLAEAEALLPISEPERCPGRVPRHPGALVGHRKGAPRRDSSTGVSPSRRGERHQGCRGRALAAQQSRGEGAGRGHRRKVGGTDRRARGTSRGS